VEVREQVAELCVRKRGSRHHVAAMEDDRGEALVGGRLAGGHGLDLGDGLQTWAVERVGVCGVVAAGAGLVIDLGTAGFFGGPLGLRLGRRQGAAAGESDSNAESAGKEGTGSSKWMNAHIGFHDTRGDGNKFGILNLVP